MVGGARKAVNVTASSLFVASIALIVGTLSSGGRRLSVSGYGSSEFLGPWQGPAPTSVLPKISGKSNEARGVLTGSKSCIHTLLCPEKEDIWVFGTPKFSDWPPPQCVSPTEEIQVNW